MRVTRCSYQCTRGGRDFFTLEYPLYLSRDFHKKDLEETRRAGRATRGFIIIHNMQMHETSALSALQ